MKYISWATRKVVHPDKAEAHVFVVKLTSPGETFPWGTRVEEHRFNPDFVSELVAALDAAESDPRVLGLVMVGEGKYFSNGMDTSFIRAHTSEAIKLQMDVEELMKRVLCSRLTTVAVLNGHTTAAGAIFSLCFDYRLMGPRGLFFTPAVRLGIVYSSGFVEVVKAKVSDPVLLRDILLKSKRFESRELEQLGLVDKVVLDSSAFLEDSVCFLTDKLERNTETQGLVKKRLYSSAFSILARPGGSSDMWWSRM